MIAQTSLQTYIDSKAEFASLKKQVYELIKGCPALSNRDIARILDRENGTISGRTNELAEEGLIRSWGVKTDPITGRPVKMWEAVA